MLKVIKVAAAGAALATLLMAAQCSNSTTPTTGSIDVQTIIADIQTACQYQANAAQVMQIAEEIAAATGNAAAIAGTTIATVVATAIEQTVCQQKAAAMAANASLKSLVKGAKEGLNITISEVTIDGKPVSIKPVTINGQVTG